MYIACGPSNVYCPRGKWIPSSRARSSIRAAAPALVGFGSPAQRTLLRRSDSAARWLVTQRLARPRPRKDDARIDVVIPVYGNRHLTLRTIDSVLAAEVKVPFELIVVDDASPDPVLAAELRQLADRGLVSLLANGTNLGFVRSANRGLLLHGDRDVVLLNSDTNVFGDWLDRLLAVLHGTPTIATVTPLSNAATILSYPIPLRDNNHSSLDYAALDKICARLNAKPVELPTGVGFCMAIKRKCIDQIGGFDFAVFGRGYGEENDFCRRAAVRGWRHAAATNVFVWHKGGGSFAEQREELVAAAQLALERRHPGYGAMILDFIALDPLQSVRAQLDAARVVADPRTKILQLGADADADPSTHELAVRLVPDIGPFWGSYRLTIAHLPSVVSLPRFHGRAGVGDVARALRDLHIEKLVLPLSGFRPPNFDENWIAAARESGVAVVGAASQGAIKAET